MKMVQRRRRGQTLVEFALAIIVILVLLFGVIDLSMAFHFHQKIVYQLNEAARFGSIYGSSDPAQIQSIREVALCGEVGCTGTTVPGLDLATLSISRSSVEETGLFTVAPETPVMRSHVVLSVTGYQYRLFTPFVGRLINTGEIRVSHPMECEDNAGCATLPTPLPSPTPTP